jgi:hypothetical protein
LLPNRLTFVGSVRCSGANLATTEKGASESGIGRNGSQSARLVKSVQPFEHLFRRWIVPSISGEHLFTSARHDTELFAQLWTRDSHVPAVDCCTWRRFPLESDWSKHFQFEVLGKDLESQRFLSHPNSFPSAKRPEFIRSSQLDFVRKAFSKRLKFLLIQIVQKLGGGELHPITDPQTCVASSCFWQCLHREVERSIDHFLSVIDEISVNFSK